MQWCLVNVSCCKNFFIFYTEKSKSALRSQLMQCRYIYYNILQCKYISDYIMYYNLTKAVFFWHKKVFINERTNSIKLLKIIYITNLKTIMISSI